MGFLLAWPVRSYGARGEVSDRGRARVKLCPYTDPGGRWMNRRELVNAVASHVGREVREVDDTLRGVTEVITGTVAKGEQVAISGFAKFAKVERPARMGRNPATGETIQI